MCGTAPTKSGERRVDAPKQDGDMGITGMNGNPDRTQRLERNPRQGSKG